MKGSGPFIAAFALVALLPGCFLAHGRPGADDDGPGGEVETGGAGDEGENGHEGETRGDTAGNVTDKYPGPCTIETESTVTEITTFIYDADGNLVRAEESADGTVTEITTYIYDADGNLVRVEEGADGTVTEITTFIYDENGNISTKENMRDPDTVLMGVLVPSVSRLNWTYTYDENGRVLSEVLNEEEVLEPIPKTLDRRDRV